LSPWGGRVINLACSLAKTYFAVTQSSCTVVGCFSFINIKFIFEFLSWGWFGLSCLQFLCLILKIVLWLFW